MLTLYFDNCCYNRPFDDRTYIKNYLEREAILIIMQMACDGVFKIVGSEVLEREMSMISDENKRKNVRGIYSELKSDVLVLKESTVRRAEEIMEQSKIKAFDSLHLACAEKGADILLTTDIKFLKAANKLNVNVFVKNPIDFLMEVGNDECNDSVSKK